MAEDLTQWLRAQLDEDERIARAATLGPWVQSGIGDYGWTVDFGRPGAGVETADTEQGLADADFIAAHNPARALREIDAKRRMLDEFTQAGSVPDTPERRTSPHWKGDFGYLQGLARAVHLLASAYADRPGYREEWRS